MFQKFQRTNASRLQLYLILWLQTFSSFIIAC